MNERLVAKYMDEVAPTVEPAAVELDVQGEISGVRVRGRVDVLDVEGRLIDFKTASRRPSCVSPDYAFQLATYQQITPGASGQVRIDSLVKTRTVQIVQQAYTVEEPDCPNRQSMLCSQKHCSFWKHCEEEFGGSWDVLQGFERFCKLRQKSHPPGYASRNALNTNQLFA